MAWTAEQLKRLKAERRNGRSVADCAAATGRSRPEVDQALWALIGRSFDQAVIALRRAERRAGQPILQPAKEANP